MVPEHGTDCKLELDKFQSLKNPQTQPSEKNPTIWLMSGHVGK